jgi:hypothetical protein
MDLMDEHAGPILSGGPAAVKRSLETRTIRRCLKVLRLDTSARETSNAPSCGRRRTVGPPEQARACSNQDVAECSFEALIAEAAAAVEHNSLGQRSEVVVGATHDRIGEAT